LCAWIQPSRQMTLRIDKFVDTKGKGPFNFQNNTPSAICTPPPPPPPHTAGRPRLWFIYSRRPLVWRQQQQQLGRSTGLITPVYLSRSQLAPSLPFPIWHFLALALGWYHLGLVPVPVPCNNQLPSNIHCSLCFCFLSVVRARAKPSPASEVTSWLPRDF
jgi:hypothetical protein